MSEEWKLFQTEEETRSKVEKLPEWVKCAYCGGRPTWEDMLGEIVADSSALAHQSCMAARGKIFGLNAGLKPDFGGTKNDIAKC